MDNFRIHYSGACFERGDSLDQVERKVRDKVVSLGKMLYIEARLLYPDERNLNLGKKNYIVSFEGEIEVQAETQVKAENQAYGQLSSLGQVTIVASKKEGE